MIVDEQKVIKQQVGKEKVRVFTPPPTTTNSASDVQWTAYRTDTAIL